MTAEPVRDIGFARWEDPDAWMESMKGARWERLIKDENERVDDFVKENNVTSLLKDFEKDIKKAQILNGIPYAFKSGPISISMRSTMFMSWKWGNEKVTESRDVFADDRGVWHIKEVGNGAEVFELEFLDSNKKSKWSIKPVGPQIAISGSRCFYLGVENRLWFNELWSCDALTGKNKKMLYKEIDPRNILSIERADSKIYVIRENAQDKIYYRIDPDESIIHIPNPLSLSPRLENTYGLDMIWHSKKLSILRQNGKSQLWHDGNKVLEIPAGKITVDPWAVHEDRKSAVIMVTQPHIPVILYEWSNGKLEKVTQDSKTDLQFVQGSINGIHYDITFKSNISSPKHVIVIGYGAYGFPTTAQYVRTRWNPLIESDWGIAYTYLPGGGDHTTAFAKSARIAGRHKTIEAFVACIKDIKNRYKLSPKDIVIYGRSAGGLLMGGSLGLHPNGDLFGGIFTEVPYVDELRTTTNPQLPLTRLEYNEFGNPKRSVLDFLSVGLLSPADEAMTLKTPNVFVYAKTAVNDSQVYAYEPMKWIRRLRANAPDSPKLLKIELNFGHFTPPDLTVKNYAFDCAVIQTLVMSK